MTRTTFSEEQMVYALRQAESGTPQTFYRWKRKFAGLGVAELRRLRQVEDENRRLKQLVSDLTLDKHMLKDAQLPLRGRLRELAAARLRCGYRRLHVLLQREGWPVNHKRVYRLYCQEGLGLQRKVRQKRASLRRVALPPATAPHIQWGMDFLSDRLSDGRRFRVLTLVDHVSRVSPAIAVAASVCGEQVAAIVEAASHYHPQRWLQAGCFEAKDLSSTKPVIRFER